MRPLCVLLVPLFCLVGCVSVNQPKVRGETLAGVLASADKWPVRWVDEVQIQERVSYPDGLVDSAVRRSKLQVQAMMGLPLLNGVRLILVPDFKYYFEGHTRLIEGRPAIVIRRVFNERVLRHEFLHALLLQHELRPPKWINEGMAEWIEGEEARAKKVRTLTAEKLPTLEALQLWSDTGQIGKFSEWELRALAMCMVETMHFRNRQSWAEIASLSLAPTNASLSSIEAYLFAVGRRLD